MYIPNHKTNVITEHKQRPTSVKFIPLKIFCFHFNICPEGQKIAANSSIESLSCSLSYTRFVHLTSFCHIAY